MSHGTANQAVRQGLSARIRFASANMILNLESCFRRPRYRVFLTAIDSIFDCLASVVSDHRVFSFLRTKIAAVAMYRFFLSVQKLGGHGNIMYIGSRSPNGMHQPAVPVHPAESAASETAPAYHRWVAGCWNLRRKSPKRLGCL